MSTNVMSVKDIQRERVTIDASGKILGRLSVEVAKLLMGKNKPNFVPYLNMGDLVVVTNASKIKVTGKKSKQKEYKRFSGYPHGLKTEKFEKLIARFPERVLEHSIKGMLPKGRLGHDMFRNLKVYGGLENG